MPQRRIANDADRVLPSMKDLIAWTVFHAWEGLRAPHTRACWQAACLSENCPEQPISRRRRGMYSSFGNDRQAPAGRGAATLSFRVLGDSSRGPFAFCDAVSCPANARATTGFMLSTIDVGIRMVAPRSLVVS